MKSAGLTVYNVLKAFCTSDVFLSLKLSNLLDRKNQSIDRAYDCKGMYDVSESTSHCVEYTAS